MQQHNMSWIETQFLKKAVDILCECRRTLMYTYVFAYYLRKNNQCEIFEVRIIYYYILYRGMSSIANLFLWFFLPFFEYSMNSSKIESIHTFTACQSWLTMLISDLDFANIICHGIRFSETAWIKIQYCINLCI